MSVGWWVLGVWIGVAVLAAVVLGFCAYEVSWKSRRLTGDLDKLADVQARLTNLQGEVQSLQRKIAAVSTSAADTSG